MNKKGFTLVELLAVIVILSIIAIITIPMISNVIEKSKLGAMEDSAYGLIDAANYYYAEHMNEMSSNKLFVIENGIGTSEEKLNYKGKIEGNAKILLASNGKVALCLTNGKSYAKKEITDTKVVINTVSSDTTCEINGIDSDSDITIDISGSNSSYYNKNEIDDKLNDIRNDLSNYVTKDELNSSLNNLNNNLSTRYNSETDYLEVLFNGEWVEAQYIGLQWNGVIFRNGLDKNAGILSKKYSSNSSSVISADNTKITATCYGNGASNSYVTYMLSKQFDITKYNSLTAVNISLSGASGSWGAHKTRMTIGVSKNADNGTSFDKSASYNNASGSSVSGQSITLDVSSLSGKYYVYIMFEFYRTDNVTGTNEAHYGTITALEFT